MKEVTIKCDMCGTEVTHNYFKTTCTVGKEELRELDFCPQCTRVLTNALKAYEAKNISVADMLKGF